MTRTNDQRDAVLTAALGLLRARLDHMVAIDEWATLAKAVARCQEQPASHYLTDDDLQSIAERGDPDWDEAADGPLPALDPDD